MQAKAYYRDLPTSEYKQDNIQNIAFILPGSAQSVPVHKTFTLSFKKTCFDKKPRKDTDKNEILNFITRIVLIIAVFSLANQYILCQREISLQKQYLANQKEIYLINENMRKNTITPTENNVLPASFFSMQTTEYTQTEIKGVKQLASNTSELYGLINDKLGSVVRYLSDPGYGQIDYSTNM